MNSCAKYSGKMLTVGRVLIGLFFLFGGISKLMDPTGTAEYMSAYGLPAASILVWVVAIFLIIVAGALIVGRCVCTCAALLAVFTILATLIFHTDFAGDELQIFFFTKNVAILGGLLLLMGGCSGNCKE